MAKTLVVAGITGTLSGCLAGRGRSELFIQRMHSVLPLMDLYLPSIHATKPEGPPSDPEYPLLHGQSELLPAEECVFAAHVKHAADELASAKGENFPASQSAHTHEVEPLSK